MGIDYSRFKFSKGICRVEERDEKKSRRASRKKQCRDYVWKRDQSIDRASGKRLSRKSTDPGERGHVHHLKAVGSHPELKYDVTNQVLLSFTNHRLEHAGRLQILGTNANRSLTFVMRDADGRELWRRTSAPP